MKTVPTSVMTPSMNSRRRNRHSRRNRDRHELARRVEDHRAEGRPGQRCHQRTGKEQDGDDAQPCDQRVDLAARATGDRQGRTRPGRGDRIAAEDADHRVHTRHRGKFGLRVGPEAAAVSPSAGASGIPAMSMMSL